MRSSLRRAKAVPVVPISGDIRRVVAMTLYDVFYAGQLLTEELHMARHGTPSEF
jgi:hypothetical protein